MKQSETNCSKLEHSWTTWYIFLLLSPPWRAGNHTRPWNLRATSPQTEWCVSPLSSQQRCRHPSAPYHCGTWDGTLCTHRRGKGCIWPSWGQARSPTWHVQPANLELARETSRWQLSQRSQFSFAAWRVLDTSRAPHNPRENFFPSDCCRERHPPPHLRRWGHELAGDFRPAYLCTHQSPSHSRSSGWLPWWWRGTEGALWSWPAESRP